MANPMIDYWTYAPLDKFSQVQNGYSNLVSLAPVLPPATTPSTTPPSASPSVIPATLPPKSTTVHSVPAPTATFAPTVFSPTSSYAPIGVPIGVPIGAPAGSGGGSGGGGGKGEGDGGVGAQKSHTINYIIGAIAGGGAGYFLASKYSKNIYGGAVIGGVIGFSALYWWFNFRQSSATKKPQE